MTKLILKPIDRTEPGSHKQRKEWRRLFARLKQVEIGALGEAEIMTILADIDDWLEQRLRTDDGSDIAPLLDAISAEEFDALFQAAGGEQPVGEAISAPSTDSTEGTAS